MKCEKCEEHKRDVFRRAEHGKAVCNRCHREIMRDSSPTNLVKVPAYLRVGRAR